MLLHSLSLAISLQRLDYMMDAANSALMADRRLWRYFSGIPIAALLCPFGADGHVQLDRYSRKLASPKRCKKAFVVERRTAGLTTKLRLSASEEVVICRLVVLAQALRACPRSLTPITASHFSNYQGRSRTSFACDGRAGMKWLTRLL